MQDWILAGGERNVFIGGSSRDIRLQGRARAESGDDREN
jgi:hypothetical protein